MIEAGIHSDDIVVVEKRTSANVGDIVVAILDNEFTLKRLDRERGRLVLRLENKTYPVIRPICLRATHRQGSTDNNSVVGLIAKCVNSRPGPAALRLVLRAAAPIPLGLYTDIRYTC